MPSATAPDDLFLQEIRRIGKAVDVDAEGWSIGAYWSIAALNDGDWQEIRRRCKAVDADTVTVRIRGLPGESKLRQALPLIAHSCDITSRLQGEVLTPKDLAQERSRIIEFCNALRTRLDDHRNYNRLDPATHLLQFHPHLFELAWRVQAALEEFAAELERCRSELTVMGSSRGKGNNTVHNQFWKELTRVWHDNVSKDNQMAGDPFGRVLNRLLNAVFPRGNDLWGSRRLRRARNSLPQTRIDSASYLLEMTA
jgi:hypothetical protein